MDKICKMDQNIPQIHWSTEGFATGGAKGAKSAKSCKMSKKSEKWAEIRKKC